MFHESSEPACPAPVDDFAFLAHQHRMEAEGGLLFFERRCHPRRQVGSRVTAVIAGVGYADAAAHRICSLQLRDLSATGVGAMVQEPLPIGATITLFCPPRGAEAGFDLRGTVVRCERQEWGFHVGIRIDDRLAA